MKIATPKKINKPIGNHLPNPDICWQKTPFDFLNQRKLIGF
jgi:hypothetical protein